MSVLPELLSIIQSARAQGDATVEVSVHLLMRVATRLVELGEPLPLALSNHTAAQQPSYPTGDACQTCGGMLVQTGKCRTCQACGTSDGGCS